MKELSDIAIAQIVLAAIAGIAFICGIVAGYLIGKISEPYKNKP